MAKKTALPNGLVVYQGPSQIDGQPIIVIVTGLNGGKSRNPKTGDMVQTWIMLADTAPHLAVKTGEDISICDGCPQRGTIEKTLKGELKNRNRICYVIVHNAPLSVWNSWKRGIYPTATAKEASKRLKGLGLRIGSYGDPGAVPVSIWRDLVQGAAYWVGYTHRWRALPELAPYCMASCDSMDDRAHAKLLGFRCFRVTTEDVFQAKDKREVICPSSEEAGRKAKCDRCKACSGTSGKAKADIVIQVHGSKGKINAAKRRAA